MSQGFKIKVQDGEFSFKVEETTGCRCMSCEDYTVYYQDEDGKQEFNCYTSPVHEDPFKLLVFLLCKKIQELERK